MNLVWIGVLVECGLLILVPAFAHAAFDFAALIYIVNSKPRLNPSVITLAENSGDQASPH